MPEAVAANADTGSTGISDADLDQFVLSDSDTGADTSDAPSEEPDSEYIGEADELNGVPEGSEETPAAAETPEIDKDLLPPPDAVEAADAPPSVAATEQQLPEGVSMRERNGRKEFVLRENRYKTFHEAHQIRRQAEQIIGEPLTPAAIERRHHDSMDWNQFNLDIVAGDPEGRLVNHLISRAGRALQSGETAADPVPTIADKFTQTIRANHPDAYVKMGTTFTRDLLDDLYSEAARTGDENLLRSAQRIEHKLWGQYRTAEQVKQGQQQQAPDEREAQLRFREQRVAQADQQRAQQDWTGWTNSVDQNSDASINRTIDEALAAEAKAYEKFPKTFAKIKTDLRDAAYKEMAADKSLQRLLKLDFDQAKVAANPQRRNELAQQIVNRIVVRAQAAINERKLNVMRERNAELKAQSSAIHSRKAAAQAHVAPGSGGAPVRQSALPNGLGQYDVANAANLERDAMKLLGL